MASNVGAGLQHWRRPGSPAQHAARGCAALGRGTRTSRARYFTKRGLAGMPDLGSNPERPGRSPESRVPGLATGRAAGFTAGSQRLAITHVAYSLTLFLRSCAAAHLGAGTVAVPVGLAGCRLAHGHTHGQVLLLATRDHANCTSQGPSFASAFGARRLCPRLHARSWSSEPASSQFVAKQWGTRCPPAAAANQGNGRTKVAWTRCNCTLRGLRSEMSL